MTRLAQTASALGCAMQAMGAFQGGVWPAAWALAHFQVVEGTGSTCTFRVFGLHYDPPFMRLICPNYGPHFMPQGEAERLLQMGVSVLLARKSVLTIIMASVASSSAKQQHHCPMQRGISLQVAAYLGSRLVFPACVYYAVSAAQRG